MNTCKLAQNLKRIRKQRGMTQDELAVRIGFNDGTAISKIERGVTSLNYDQIDAVCKVLNVKATQLFGYEEIEAKTQDNSEFLAYIPYLQKANEATLQAVRKLLDMPEKK